MALIQLNEDYDMFTSSNESMLLSEMNPSKVTSGMFFRGIKDGTIVMFTEWGSNHSNYTSFCGEVADNTGSDYPDDIPPGHVKHCWGADCFVLANLPLHREIVLKVKLFLIRKANPENLRLCISSEPKPKSRKYIFKNGYTGRERIVYLSVDKPGSDCD